MAYEIAKTEKLIADLRQDVFLYDVAEDEKRAMLGIADIFEKLSRKTGEQK